MTENSVVHRFSRLVRSVYISSSWFSIIIGYIFKVSGSGFLLPFSYHNRGFPNPIAAPSSTRYLRGFPLVAVYFFLTGYYLLSIILSDLNFAKSQYVLPIASGQTQASQMKRTPPGVTSGRYSCCAIAAYNLQYVSSSFFLS